MIKNIELYLQAVDTTDTRDYIYEDIYMKDHWNGIKAGPIWDTAKMKIYNQFDQTSTYKACSCYGLWWVYNGNNVEEYWQKEIEFEQEDPKNKRFPFQAKRGRPNEGASLQNMMKFYIKRERIEWYLKVNTEDGMKNAIDNQFLIYSGTKYASWRKTWAEWKFVYYKNWGWHCFFIVWYDDIGRICVNSFGKKRGKDWYFTVPYADTKYLFTRYAIVDHDDTGVLKNMEYQKEILESIALWLTDWTRPKEPASREEVWVIWLRVLKKALQK
jgi:hypothetical protein